LCSWRSHADFSAIKKRGKYRYSESQADIRAEVLRYGNKNAYPAHHFADSLCACGGKRFRLSLDDTEGAAVRTCVGCDSEHPIGDSDEYLEDAESMTPWRSPNKLMSEVARAGRESLCPGFHVIVC
jgi:hypothetical protein